MSTDGSGHDSSHADTKSPIKKKTSGGIRGKIKKLVPRLGMSESRASVTESSVRPPDYDFSTESLMNGMHPRFLEDGREDLFGYKRGEIDSTADSHGAFSTERGITTERILDEHRPATIPVVGTLSYPTRAESYQKLSMHHEGAWDLVHEIHTINKNSELVAHSKAALRDTASNVVHLYDTNVLIKWSSEHQTLIYSRKDLSRHQKERLQWKARAFRLFPEVTFKQANSIEFCREALREWAMCRAVSHEASDTNRGCTCNVARYFLEIGNLRELGFMCEGAGVDAANRAVTHFGGRAWLIRSSAVSTRCRIPLSSIFTITRMRSKGTPCSHRIVRIQGFGYCLLDPGCDAVLEKVETVDEGQLRGLFLKYSACFVDMCYYVLGRNITAANLISAQQVKDFLANRRVKAELGSAATNPEKAKAEPANPLLSQPATITLPSPDFQKPSPDYQKLDEPMQPEAVTPAPLPPVAATPTTAAPLVNQGLGLAIVVLLLAILFALAYPILFPTTR